MNDDTSVRNYLEMLIGNFLIDNNFMFEYEPYININNKAYFPDFRVGKKIIEVTEWKHPKKDKISYLKNKIKHFHEKGFEIEFFIPKDVRNFYKDVDGSIVSTLPELKKILMPQ